MKAYSTDFRQKMLETYLSTPISQRPLAKKFSVALSFIQKRLKQHRLTGDVSPLPHGGGRKLKLNPEQIQVLAELNEEKNDATLEEIQHRLYEKTGVYGSQLTIFRMIERFNLSLKKTLYPENKEREKVQKLRLEFLEKIRGHEAKNLIFIDEMGVNLSLIRRYARSLRGTRARGSKPNKRGQNVSVLGAISLNKVVTSINLVGGIDGLAFEAFIIQKRVPKLWKEAVVLLDNYSIHKGKNIEKAVREAGAELIYLPPYSPDFSPIENFWSLVPRLLKPGNE